MGIERCYKCGRHVDTDLHENGLYEDGQYVCVECDSKDAADAIIRLLERTGLNLRAKADAVLRYSDSKQTRLGDC